MFIYFSRKYLQTMGGSLFLCYLAHNNPRCFIDCFFCNVCMVGFSGISFVVRTVVILTIVYLGSEAFQHFFIFKFD